MVGVGGMSGVGGVGGVGGAGGADSAGGADGAGGVVGGGKTPVVLLHGWMMNRRCWDEVAARLHKRFNLFIVELPGHEVRGETDGGARPFRADETPGCGADSETNSSARLLRIAGMPEHSANGDNDETGARLLRIAEPPGRNANSGSVFSRPGELVAALAAAAPRRAVWVGWSLGGVLAQLAACRYPERVAGLVCIAAAARFVACDEWPHGMARTVFDDFAAAFARDADGAARRFLSLQTAGNDDAALLRRLRQAAARGGAHTEQAHAGHAHTEHLHAGQARAEHAHAEQAAALRFLGGSDLRCALRDCRCRADFIGAGRDRLVAARAVEQSSRLVRDGRFHHIADAAHAAPISHAERICEIIRQCAEHARATA